MIYNLTPNIQKLLQIIVENSLVNNVTIRHRNGGLLFRSVEIFMRGNCEALVNDSSFNDGLELDC